MESTIRAPVQRSAAYRVWQNVRTYLNGQDYVPRTDIQPPPVPQRSPTLEWQLRAHRATTSALVALVDLNANAIQLGEAPAPHMAEMISYLREDSQRREVALEKSGEKARYGTAIDNYLDTLQQNREQMEQTDLPPLRAKAQRAERIAMLSGALAVLGGMALTYNQPDMSERLKSLLEVGAPLLAISAVHVRRASALRQRSRERNREIMQYPADYR